MRKRQLFFSYKVRHGVLFFIKFAKYVFWHHEVK